MNHCPSHLFLLQYVHWHRQWWRANMQAELTLHLAGTEAVCLPDEHSIDWRLHCLRIKLTIWFLKCHKLKMIMCRIDFILIINYIHIRLMFLQLDGNLQALIELRGCSNRPAFSSCLFLSFLFSNYLLNIWPPKFLTIFIKTIYFRVLLMSWVGS